MTHVNHEEIEKVKNLIEVLQMRQSLLSDTTLISEDALCPICYAQQNGELKNEEPFRKLLNNFPLLDVIFEPCLHQSCHSCIIQHLMSVKLCFYCKTHIISVRKYDGTVIYTSEPPSSPPTSRDTEPTEIINDPE
jgi:Kip1 ubiquitination-promoting complex protein 1